MDNERAFSAAWEQHAIKRRTMSPETLEAVCLIAGNVGDDIALSDLVAETRKLALERSERDPFDPNEDTMPMEHEEASI